MYESLEQSMFNNIIIVLLIKSQLLLLLNYDRVHIE